MDNEDLLPYRTGTYRIFDNDPERPAKDHDGNFRSGRSLDPPLRASGSHQLDAEPDGRFRHSPNDAEIRDTRIREETT